VARKSEKCKHTTVARVNALSQNSDKISHQRVALGLDWLERWSVGTRAFPNRGLQLQRRDNEQ
jgi:hypothetical protein